MEVEGSRCFLPTEFNLGKGVEDRLPNDRMEIVWVDG